MIETFAPYKWEALFARWPDMLVAFGTTVGISVLALLIALALGVVFGVFSVSRLAVLRGVTRVYVEVVQNVPLLLQVFVLYAIFPLLGFTLAAFWIGVLAIGIYHGGYMSEVVRSGIGSIHRGQFEAAKSQGFSYWQTMFVIILPQALRIILPPLAVQAANLVKNTSVLALIAGGELMYFSNSFAGATSYYGPAYVVAAVLYFAICFPLSRLALYLEHRTRSHRHLATGDATEELCEDTMEVTPGTHDITGSAAAATMAGGVDTMYETVDIAPARQAPSPRHPLHVWGEAEVSVGSENDMDKGQSDGNEVSAEGAVVGDNHAEAVDVSQRFTGRVAAEIADEIGRELAQEIAKECGSDEECIARVTHTRAGRSRLHLRAHHRAEEKMNTRRRIMTEDDQDRMIEQQKAVLGEEAFLDNDYVSGELNAPAERLSHVRAPQNETDFDAEAEDAVRTSDDADNNGNAVASPKSTAKSSAPTASVNDVEASSDVFDSSHSPSDAARHENQRKGGE